LKNAKSLILLEIKVIMLNEEADHIIT